MTDPNKRVTIDRSKRLRDEPHTGHNRWHADLPPVIEVDPEEDVLLETRDAGDGQIGPATTAAEVAQHFDLNIPHPLTGPVYVKGAEPGDLLEIEFVEIDSEPYGWTLAGPNGFLPDLLTETYLVHWEIEDGWATSEQIPQVRIPGAPFMGTAGVAPSRDLMQEWAKREDALAARGGTTFPRQPLQAVPSSEPVASEGFRTIPPRENGGNADIKQLTAGSRLILPVFVAGGLYSAGDAHFAQGDSECCLFAIEVGATHVVRFRVHKGEAARQGIRWPRFAHDGYFAPPEWAAPRRFVATTGMPVTDDGFNDGENLSLAARNAMRNMVSLLVDRGLTPAQAYVICSVAVDLRVSNVVDLPNVTVSALLPEDIFVDAAR